METYPDQSERASGSSIIEGSNDMQKEVMEFKKFDKFFILYALYDIQFLKLKKED
jgi:hypothetical protein